MWKRPLWIGALLVLAAMVAPGRLVTAGAPSPLVTGLYVGRLDFSSLDLPAEPVAATLGLDGSATMITMLEPGERESSLIGTWSFTRRGEIRVGVLAFRRGTMAVCDFIVAPQGSSSDDCVLRIGIVVRRVGRGRLQGSALITAEEVDAATGEVIRSSLPAVPIELTKEPLENFDLP